MKRNVIVSIIVLCLIYVSGYILIRQMAQEIWEVDGETYVIFPNDKVFYHFYRPLSYVDGVLTGMKFHIGQH